MRLNLDPLAGAGGGLTGNLPPVVPPGQVAAPPPPDEFEVRLANTLAKLGFKPGAPAPAAGAPAPEPPDPIWERVQRTELTELRATSDRLKALEAEKRKSDEEALIKAGKWEELVKDRTAQLAAETAKTQETGRQFKASLRDRDISTALAGHPLVSGAAKQILSLIRDQFDVHEEAGQLVVRSRTLEPVEVAVKNLLATADYSHFLRATSQGGAGSTGAGATTATPAANAGQATEPKNLSEAVVQRWTTLRAQAAAAGQSHIGLSGRMPSAAGPIGLGK